MAGMRHTWRVSVGGQIAGVLGMAFGIGMNIGTIGAITDGGINVNRVVGVFFTASVVLLSFRFALWPKISLTNEQIIVRNPLRTIRIEVSRIEVVEAGYGGIVIATSDNVMEIAWAVQKSNLTGWLHRRTRADEVVACIREAMRVEREAKKAASMARTHRRDPQSRRCRAAQVLRTTAVVVSSTTPQDEH
jgi:hypothetical protein